MRATEKAISKALASAELWAPGTEDDTVTTLAQEVAMAVAATLKPVFQKFKVPANCVDEPPIPEVRAYIFGSTNCLI